MGTDLSKSLLISASGMRAQSMRMRIISENLANAGSVASTPGGDPYRRKTVSFKAEIDRMTGAEVVKVKDVGVDKSPFEKRYDPGHPAAGPDGYIKLPNVNGLIELMDMRQAQQSYEANLNAIDVARAMLERTVELLRP